MMEYYSAMKGMKYWYMLQPGWILNTYAWWEKPVTESHVLNDSISGVQNK